MGLPFFVTCLRYDCRAAGPSAFVLAGGGSQSGSVSLLRGHPLASGARGHELTLQTILACATTKSAHAPVVRDHFAASHRQPHPRASREAMTDGTKIYVAAHLTDSHLYCQKCARIFTIVLREPSRIRGGSPISVARSRTNAAANAWLLAVVCNRTLLEFVRSTL